MTGPLTAGQAPARIGELADLLADQRIEYERAEDVAKSLHSAYEQTEAQLFDALEDLGVTSFRTERGLFMLNDLAWASVDDEQAAKAWADKYMPELLTLNRQRLATIVRQVLKGEDPVPGLEPGQQPPGVTFRTSRKINWRRNKT